jgi:two-component sensor histidine kinase
MKVISMKDASRHATFNDYTKEEAKQRAVLALEAGRMGSWDWDIANGKVTGDQLIADILGVDYFAQPWSSEEMMNGIHPEDFQIVQEAFDQGLNRDEVFEVEHRSNPTVGPLMWLQARGRVTARAEDGTPLHLMGVTWDISAQKKVADRLEMMTEEMNHRVKNSFAVIRGLINIAGKDYDEVGPFATMLRAQIEAMSTSHLLTTEMAQLHDDHTHPVPFRQLVSSGLEAWMIDPAQERITINIAPEHAISPKHAEAFSMLIYELATNAAKHGALSRARGRIDIAITPDIQGTFLMEWRETCPMMIRAPETKGFGTTLTMLCCSNLAASDVTKIWNDTGLHFSMRLPGYDYTPPLD